MATSFPFRFSAIVCLSTALLSGCCANDVCECNDADADTVRFRFRYSADTTVAVNTFRPADLDTITIERSPLPYDPKVKPETVVLYRTPAQANDTLVTLVLNNNAPFAQKPNTKLNSYRYVVSYRKNPPVKGTPTTVLVIDRVELSGTLDGDGCCTCYTNTRKAIYTNGNPVVRELQPGDVVEITKP
ncbi:MAG TPA: hypothetical protein VF629_04250 [Hymenobacter sp.]|jgi:hypothetical protein|uniref:hypothetical protein n=1 Tax=Hymenobacter sp. TaxID=1898978 RepID=UPI002ED987C0